MIFISDFFSVDGVNAISTQYLGRIRLRRHDRCLSGRRILAETIQSQTITDQNARYGTAGGFRSFSGDDSYRDHRSSYRIDQFPST